MSKLVQQALVQLGAIRFYPLVGPDGKLGRFSDSIGNLFMQSRTTSGPECNINPGGQVDLGQVNEAWKGHLLQVRPVLSPITADNAADPGIFVADAISVTITGGRVIPLSQAVDTEGWEPEQSSTRVTPGFYTADGKAISSFRTDASQSLAALRAANENVDW